MSEEPNARRVQWADVWGLDRSERRCRPRPVQIIISDPIQ